MQPHGCVHIRMFVLHAAIVPACVGLYAALSMAHWCQFFPMLVYAARACCKQARTVVARVVCMRWCPVGVHVCAAGLAFPCQTCLLNAGLCHRCMHLHICVQVSLGPMAVCVLPTLFPQVRYMPYHAAAVVGGGIVIPGCVPGLVCPYCVYLYVSGGGTHLCCAHWALPARVACGYICMGVALVCAVCSVHCNA
jgi:hypothetical protein